MLRMTRFVLQALLAIPATALAGYVELVQTNHPVAYWRLAEVTPPPATSTAINRGTEGTRLNGTYLGGVTLGQPSAITNDTDTSALFSPSAGQHAEIPNHPSFNNAFTVSVELWAKVTGGAGLRCAVSSLQVIGANRYGYAVCVTETGQWQFRTGRGSLTEGFNIVSGPAATVGEWVHLVGVYEASGPAAVNRLYVNGQLVADLSGRAEMNQSNPQRIGASSIAFGAAGDFFQGGIDEVAIYRRALSAAEIWSHYSAGTAYASRVFAAQPNGYWRMNETPPDPPTTAVNAGSLGTTANGQYLNGASGGVVGAILTGPTNRAALFDGADDKIEVPFLTPLNAVPFTVECWANPPLGSSQPGAVVSSRDNGASLGTRGWVLGKDGADRWYFWLGNGQTYPATLVGPTVRNRWQHLVGSYDGTFARLYVDATLVEVRRTNFIANTTRLLRIGADANELPLGAEFFQGGIDEVAIYTNALTDDQVLDHFGAAGQPAPVPVGPTIIESPVNTTNYVGETVELAVSAAGSLPLSYQWQRNGVDMLGATSPTLTITNITLPYAGRYRARVFNSVSSAVSYEAVLSVEPEGFPVILEQPKPMTIYVGGTARFHVEATGGTNLLYEWQHNGTALANATNATLAIANVRTINAGQYRVRVASSRGLIFSDAAQLDTETPAPGSYPAAAMADNPLAYWRLGERTGLVATDSASGYHADIYSNVGLGHPGALASDSDTAFWYTAGYFSWVEAPDDFAPPSAEFSVEAWAKLADAPDTHRVVIGSFTANPARGFRLEVSPQGRWEFWLGSDDGISVITGPVATRGVWSHVVGVWDGRVQRLYLDGAQVGQRTSSHQPAAGWPLRIGADSLDGGAGIIGTAFFDGDIDEAAFYNRPLTGEQVVAHYGAGVGKVLRPQIMEEPDSVAVFTGYPATFKALAYGSPPLAYQWQFNSANLANQTNATLTLTNVTTANAGNYRVLVSNAAGSVVSAPASLSLVTLPHTTYPAAVRDSGAISYWRLGETAGVTALDSAGARPGTYVSGVVLKQPGVDTNDFAASFIKEGGTHVQVPLSSALNAARFSIEAWARVTGASNTLRAPVTSRIDAPQRGYALMASVTDTWQFWTGRGDLSGWDIVDGPPVEQTVWTHLVGTYDGVTKRLYVNGQLAGKSNGPFAVNDLAPLRIGGDHLASEALSSYYQGDLDEVAVYAKDLTPEEILIHYGLITQVVEPPTLGIARDGEFIVISWAGGTLQAASAVVGPWNNVNATSPLQIQPTLVERYYRVKQ